MRASPFAVLVALFPVVASAQYDYLDFKNLADAQHRFQYYIDSRSQMPDGLDVSQVKAAAEAAWSQWDLTCAVPKSQSMGFSSSFVPQPSNPYDVFNVTPVFITTTSDPFYGNVFGYDLSAVSLPLTYGGVLEQCDIFLNGATREWSVSNPPPGSGNTLDVQSVMVHEIGHCLGIDHNPQYMQSVMVASVLPGVIKRSLTPEDADMLCQRYPAVGQVGSPCPDGGSCTGTLKCVTQATASGTVKFCTNGCATGTNAPCALPLTCTASTDFAPAQNGACLRPNNNVTPVGKDCGDSLDCPSTLGVCQQPAMQPSGTTFWQDGYCTQTCMPGSPPCPAGSACTQVGAAEICLQSCRVGFADCRPGYTCVQTDNGGVCAPRCEQNADCPLGFACRTCDGLCLQLQNQTQPGDRCDESSSCGFGQQCIRVGRNSDIAICSSGCGSGCQACPTGSSCHPVPNAGNQLFCLRNCTTGTCPAGLQCANLPTGRGCLPPCTFDADCPVGTTCNFGECNIPVAEDAGCGLLNCPSPDAGRPITPKPRDGGTGGGGNGGCGCNNFGAPLWFALCCWPWRRSWRRRAR